EFRERFYTDIAKNLASRKFSEMVYAIDGLMHSEPYKYWLQNRQLFDSVYEMGGLDLFIGDTLPFTKLNTIDGLSKSIGKDFSNLRILSDKLKELSEFDLKQSDVAILGKHLSREFKNRKNEISSYEG